jgi:hypothetical protein
MCGRSLGSLLLTIALLSGHVITSAAATDDAATVAGRIDQLLAKDASAGGSAPGGAPRVDDVAFLRRVSLDVAGRLPAPAEVTAFALDPAPNKRAAAVERLLAGKEYGQNWARYWRDSILYRRSDERALLVGQAVVALLTDELNKNTPWDQIAHRFITAKGDVRGSGETAIIFAQMADPSNVTAEVSRLFMGVQIQCAECHDHPTDRWKRQQFHELAAFFPRVAVRPVRDGERRSFEVVSLSRPIGRRSPGATERVKLEHYMPDLENPSAAGTLVKPVFFPTGQSLRTGASDRERREQLAEWITARGNGWFSKAIVNRMWGELVGQGFYEPLDDLGPDRKPVAPNVLDYLASQFTEHRYDLKWLIRTIAATSAYQRESRSRQDAAPTVAFTSNCPQRLRADQLFDSLSDVLGLADFAPRRAYGPRARFNNPRGQINQTFGYDPSGRRDELTGSIPQALLLMNSPELARGMSSQRPQAPLGKLIAQKANDETIVGELYLRCLARAPNDAELQACLAYVKAASNRGEALEDVLWALVNSTEFLHRK